MSLRMSLTPSSELSAALPQLYWDIKRLAGIYRPKDRETNKRTLDEAMEVISREDAVPGWSPFLCQRFVMTACALAREALLAGPTMEAGAAAGLLTPEQRADLLCSFAAAATQLPLMGKLQAGSVWVMTQLDNGPPLVEPEAALAQALAALQPLNLPAEDANDQVRAQIVLHVGRRIETGQRLSPEVEEVARQWCTELLNRGQLVTILHRAARNLGVILPQRSPLSPDGDRPREERFRVTPPPGLGTETPRPTATQELPSLWKPPEEMTPAAQQREYLACLLKLQSLARDKNGPITVRTAESLYDLGPETDLGIASKALYFAARELWKSFTQLGVAAHLDLARRAALLAYRGTPLDGERRERAGALYLWMNALLPSLIATCDLNDLIADAHRLYAQQGCRPGELYLRQGILEAHAGVCRQRAQQGDAEGRLQLLQDAGPVLRQIHDEYLRLAASVNYRPSEDALAAWDYLLPATGPDGRPTAGDASENTLLADPLFCDVIRRGSPDGVQQFVESRYPEIKDLLMRRLDVRLSPEHVLWPEGTIRNTRATDNKTPDPAFLDAHSLLEQGRFEEARLAFNHLAEHVQVRGAVNRPREICRNYEAFAWARQGEPTFARNCLKELIAGDFPFPSAYWNYACCLAEEEKDGRLGVLLKGIERAPHMLALRAAIQLALELEDRPRLRQWLPCLVETEALLLCYYYDFPRLDLDARDAPVLRLAQYVVDGGEPYMPDPSNRELRGGEVNDFIAALLDRHMEKAVEFWLRCREQEPSVRFRFDFWESKTDFLDAVKRRGEAAESFREEMRCRLNLIRSGKFKGPQIFHTTRARLEQWLEQCMTPELRTIGNDIFQMVAIFEQQSSDHPGLLPRVPRIRHYFRETSDVGREAIPRPDRVRPDVGLAGGADRQGGMAPTRDPKPLPAGAERRVRLPDLLADSLDGNPIPIDPSAVKSAFAVIVGFALDEEGNEPLDEIPVRLRGATAKLDDGALLPLRDRLDDFPVVVGPDRMAVLTFETVPGLRWARPLTVVIDIAFEIAGVEHRAESSEVTLIAQPCPAFPEPSPFIYFRPLQPDEIEGHFFGRESERAGIFDSLAKKQLRYIEGIRRIGKSSLLRGVEVEIAKRKLPWVPAYWSAAAAPFFDNVGLVLHNLFAEVVKQPELAAAGLELPNEQRCKDNPSAAYDQFCSSFTTRLPGKQILVLVDDFQVLVEHAHSSAERNPNLAEGIKALLNLIDDRMTRAHAPLLWLFAGHRAFRDFRRLLPNALLWGTARALPLDFLDLKAVGRILADPFKGTSVVVPPETAERLFELTAGHPEVVQYLAAEMLLRAQAEKRPVLTPSDAQAAAQELASHRESFSDTWYPFAELTGEQRSLIAAFVNAVKPGERIEAKRLVPGGHLHDGHNKAIEDLVERKILVGSSNGVLGIKAYVLDLWLHKALPELITESFNGSVAIFIDVANLTNGTGAAQLRDLNTPAGEGVPGTFSLATAIDRIEDYARTLSPAPIGARWVVNYPVKSAAVVECNAKGYQVENIPPDLFHKGSDDVVLRNKVGEVVHAYPAINHFVLVAGDKDYRVTVEWLLKIGKLVHVVGRAQSVAGSYHALARQFPKHFTVTRLEELLERGHRGVNV